MRVHGVVLVLVLALSGCNLESPSAKLPASDEVLSQYQTIYIGSESLTLPTIMLLSSTKNSSLTLRDGTQVPIESVLSQSTDGTSVSQIGLSIHAYRQLQDYDLDKHAFVSVAFCKRLLARWETDYCTLGLYNGKDSFYPQHFQVIERDYLTHSDEQLFAIAGGGPTGGESARRLLQQPSEVSIECVPNQHPLCTAVMPIRGDLVAVWATRREDLETDRGRIVWLMEQYLSR